MIVQKLLPIAVAAAVIVSVLGGASAAFGQPATSAATAKPTQSLLQVLASNANFTTFVRLLNRTNETREILIGPGNYTLFAPTNAAFARLSNATLADLMNNTTALEGVLRYHIVPMKISPSDFVGNGTILTLQNDSRLAYSVDGTTVKVNDAVVNTREINATNGVIYAIDTVVMPPTTAAATETAGGGFLGMPGFEAVYAVAVLLVVSFLLMRRRK